MTAPVVSKAYRKAWRKQGTTEQIRARVRTKLAARKCDCVHCAPPLPDKDDDD
jgi:hypothetical protein